MTTEYAKLSPLVYDGPMKLTTIFFAALVALVAFAEPPAGTIQVNARAIRWNDGPPSLPKGTKVAVLEGDPKTAGIFTMRLAVPAGAKVMPHRHPRAERVTIISGEVSVGFGERWDDAALRTFHNGDFYVNPANAAHFVLFNELSVIQITGEGPWELKLVE